MKSFTTISRRKFLTHAGMTALAAKALPYPCSASTAPSFACTASDRELRLYATQGKAWTLIQTIPSEAPVSLVSDPRHQALHVLHAVSEHHGLPCGYIESFRINTEMGYLRSFATQPLSLSATRPGHMTLSPDGKTLAVAVHGGSAYNLMPIRKDDSVGRPIAIRKETSLDNKSLSRPIQVAFNSIGDRIVALDQGNASLSIFSTQAGLPVLSRLFLPRNSYPAHFTYYPHAHLFFAVNEPSGSLLTIQHNPASNELSLVSQNTTKDFRGPLALDLSTQTLFAATADSVDIYSIQTKAEELQHTQRLSYPHPDMNIHLLFLDVHSHSLYLATKSGIFRSEAGAHYSNFSQFEKVASASHAIAFF